MEAIAAWFAWNWRRMLSWFKDDVFRQLFVNAGWLLSGTFVATLLGLFSTVIKARTLGPGLFGLLAVITAYVAIVGRLTTFQPWIALIKYGASALEDERPDEFMGLVKLSLLLDLVGAVSGTMIAIAGAFLLAGWHGWDPRMSRMIVVFSISLLFGFSGTPTGVLRLLDRFRIFTAQKVLTASLTLAGAVVVCAAGWGIWGFLIVTLVSTVIGNLFLIAVAFVVLKEDGLLRHWRTGTANRRPFLRFAGWTYANSTLDIPFKELDIIIVSAVVSLEATGIYKLIKQIVQIMTMLADPLYQAVYPQFAAMIANNDSRRAARYAIKIGAVIAGVIGPPALLLAVLAPWWLGAVFGQRYAAGVFALILFLLLRTISTACATIHPLFNAMGYVKQSTMISLVANCVYVLLAWYLGKWSGLIGLAIAYGVLWFIIVSAKTVIVHRHVCRAALQSGDAIVNLAGRDPCLAARSSE
jgi:O-antigen/teichoic acid export membrane protein